MSFRRHDEELACGAPLDIGDEVEIVSGPYRSCIGAVTGRYTLKDNPRFSVFMRGVNEDGTGLERLFAAHELRRAR